MNVLRRRDALAVRDEHLGPSMTPMVDVVLVILIFFMASAVFLVPELLLDAALASSEQGERGSAPDAAVLREPELTITLRAAGSGAGLGIVADGLGVKGMSPDELPIATTAADLIASGATVVVHGEDRVPYEAVLRVVERLRDAGVDRIAIR